MDRLPTKLPFSSKTLRVKVVVSYIFDYVIIIVLVAAFYALDAVEPFHQQFSLRNYTLRYPFAEHERVPIPLLLGVVGIAPIAIIAIYTLVLDGLFSTKVNGHRRRYSLKSRLWELNCGILGLLLGIGAAFVITGALKNAIGKPRPDLIDRCKPNPEVAQALLVNGNYSLAQHSICQQQDNAILKDGFRSFPSGHSSSAFAGLFYLSLYLAGKLHLLDSRGEVWKSLIVLIPTLGAALIAGSRIMDARHHPFDVITGSLLGMLSAWAAYRQYFPSLGDFHAKGRAYPIRTWGSIGDRPTDADMIPLGAELEEPRFATGTASPGTGNAFRDEIGLSQRRRTLAPHPNPDTSRNPFARPPSRGQYATHDSWASSSSSSPALDDDARALELQHPYPAAGLPAPPLGAQDTSYARYKPSAAEAVVPQMRMAGAPPRDTRDEPPPGPPPHADANAASPPARGVTLTETYVR